MLTSLLFSRAFCRPSRVTAGTMGPMEGANWTLGTCICFHWLCGPLVCYWPLCGHHGCSWSVLIGVVFATSLFTHPSLSHPTPPRLSSHPPPLSSILTAERDDKNTLKFSHQRQKRLAII